MEHFLNLGQTCLSSFFLSFYSLTRHYLIFRKGTAKSISKNSRFLCHAFYTSLKAAAIRLQASSTVSNGAAALNRA